jgi:6-pyruvoyltetrahydropterin/6-carboxytetrahydropterin synthase
MDFGGLKRFKTWSEWMFDHTLIVAEDDPMLDRFKDMSGWSSDPEHDGNPDRVQVEPYLRKGVCDLRIVEGVGCEMFAKMSYDAMLRILHEMKSDQDSRYPVNSSVRIKSAEVFEHAGNSAIYEG